MGIQAERERCLEAYVLIFTYICSCSGLTLLLESFAEKKKRFSRGFLANTARFLRISSLETVRFLAPRGITNFGAVQAKHCNHVFCSFVLQIN